ncbi:MAG: MATE family efflux transporter [Butyricicoccus sp.]|nr:MATE family efflux transporter [Butyricicoccus sp.]
MRKLIRDKKFYSTFAVLTVSIALQNLLTHSVNLADNIMIARYSQDALAGVSLCNQIQFFLQMLVVGVGEGVVVLGARYWGQKKYEPIRHIIGVGLRFGTALAGVMFVAALLFPAQIIRLLTNDAGVAAEAIAYLQIICFTYVLFTFTNILTASLRSIGIVKIGYIISFSTLCINCCLNYCLIYGNFGCPELGVRGAAIATLVSRAVELLIVVLFLKYKEQNLNLNWRRLLFIDTSYVNDYIKVALPVLITQAMWGLASIVQTSILGNMVMSGEILPANSAAVNINQILTVVAYGAASGAGVLTGRTLGETDDLNYIKDVAYTFQISFLIIGAFTTAIILLSRPLVLTIYSSLSAQAAAYTDQFMIVLAVTSFGTSYQMATDCGIMRAGGDTKFAMYNNAIFMWGICLPSAAICAFVLKASPVLVFFCLKMDQLLKCPVIWKRVHSYKWIKKVTR